MIEIKRSSSQKKISIKGFTSITKRRVGFTLIELLVVLLILGILAGVAATMFVSIIRNSRKARVMTEVKQNGGYVINVMERAIHNALSIQSPTTSISTNEIILLNPDGTSTIRFSCEQIGGLAVIASDSAALTSHFIQVKDCSSIFTVDLGLGQRPDVISIDFTLEQATGTEKEEQAEATFRTTVGLRNY